MSISETASQLARRQSLNGKAGEAAALALLEPFLEGTSLRVVEVTPQLNDHLAELGVAKPVAALREALRGDA